MIFLFLCLAIKKIKGHIPDSTIVSLSLFQFSLVLFLYFSPSINHVGPIIVFASGICFLAACIFPLFLHSTIQHHLNQQLTDLFQYCIRICISVHVLIVWVCNFEVQCFTFTFSPFKNLDCGASILIGFCLGKYISPC